MAINWQEIKALAERTPLLALELLHKGLYSEEAVKVDWEVLTTIKPILLHATGTHARTAEQLYQLAQCEKKLNDIQKSTLTAPREAPFHSSFIIEAYRRAIAYGGHEAAAHELVTQLFSQFPPGAFELWREEFASRSQIKALAKPQDTPTIKAAILLSATTLTTNKEGVNPNSYKLTSQTLSTMLALCETALVMTKPRSSNRKFFQTETDKLRKVVNERARKTQEDNEAKEAHHAQLINPADREKRDKLRNEYLGWLTGKIDSFDKERRKNLRPFDTKVGSDCSLGAWIKEENIQDCKNFFDIIGEHALSAITSPDGFIIKNPIENLGDNPIQTVFKNFQLIGTDLYPSEAETALTEDQHRTIGAYIFQTITFSTPNTSDKNMALNALEKVLQNRYMTACIESETTGKPALELFTEKCSAYSLREIDGLLKKDSITPTTPEDYKTLLELRGEKNPLTAFHLKVLGGINGPKIQELITERCQSTAAPAPAERK